MNTQIDEVESVTPMSDQPSARQIARERVAAYYTIVADTQNAPTSTMLFPAKQKPQMLTQADIDRSTGIPQSEFTRRAVRLHRKTLRSRILRLFR